MVIELYIYIYDNNDDQNKKAIITYLHDCNK